MNESSRYINRTVVRLDFVGSRETINNFYAYIGDPAIEIFNNRIKDFVKDALRSIDNRNPPEERERYEGDGCYLTFTDSNDAYKFAEAFYHLINKENQNQQHKPEAWKFRVGAATGKVYFDDEQKIGGQPMSDAQRLEKYGADPGCFCVDNTTYKNLQVQNKDQLFSQKTVKNFEKQQNEEQIQAWCCQIISYNSDPSHPMVNYDISPLVFEVRSKVKDYIKERCGIMQVLDMTQPIELTGEHGIYINVNILNEITGRRRLTLAEFSQNDTTAQEFDRSGLSSIKEERVPGLQAVEQHSKLMVFGKPGAGKTTFLKYLAMQCIEEKFQKERFPIFITLKDFAEAPQQPNLLEYIAQQLSKCKITDASEKAEQLLENGKVLVLLDGLDEVRKENTKRVLTEVQEFSYQFLGNQFVITCRIAAKEYTFQGFTEVEVADFDESQISTFAQNWFRFKNDPVKGERFIQKLNYNKPIKELATNPLLLTLLCLVFGEAGDFPGVRSELYKECVNVLLKKWDVKRNIERDMVYKNLSVQRKEDLLSQIGFTTFDQKDYFFQQKTVEKYIADYISNLPDVSTALKELELDSETVLKSIEAQHGLLVERAKNIYSFSHSTFQEYFTAREIERKSAYESLVEHITEKRWREVFLLTSEMMREADNLLLLMKKKIETIFSGDEKLRQFLTWVKEKSESVEAIYKPAVVRAIFFARDFDRFRDYDLDLAFALVGDRHSDLIHDQVILLVSDRNIDRSFVLRAVNSYYLDHVHNLEIDLDFAFDFARNLTFDPQLALVLDIVLAFASALNLNALAQSLQQLKDQIPDSTDIEAYKQWWEEKGQAWSEQLRIAMIQHRNIGRDWQFSAEQTNLLHQYYDANKLLVDCLNSDCYVSREIRQKIENELLLPLAEIP